MFCFACIKIEFENIVYMETTNYVEVLVPNFPKSCVECISRKAFLSLAVKNAGAGNLSQLKLCKYITDGRLISQYL